MVKYVYTLGASGERVKVEELDRTVEYTYDELYRLTSETITKGKTKTTYAYEYDNVSNSTLKNVDGVETVYTYNSLNQLVFDSETTYEYDLNGNLIRVIGKTNSALYVYNAENKLIKATVQNGSLVIEESYTYDYQGNRTSKTTHKSNGEIEYIKYLNDNSSLTNVLAEIDENGTAKCVYTIGADLVSQERDGKVSVYLYDGHGSVVGLANESGVVTDTYSYDAFGNLLKSKGSTKNCYRYCGEQFDETTGLYYLRARYMDTSTGRFISQDSYAGSISDPVSLHKYLYANANPVTYSDPSGYFSLGELVGCTSVLEVLTKSAGFIMLNALRGAIAGAICGAVDSILGGNSFSDVFKDALKGALSGALIGAAISALTCLGVIYAEAIIILQIFRGSFVVLGVLGVYVSSNEGNVLQAVFRAILALFSYVSMGKLIDNVKIYNLYNKNVLFETDCGNGSTRSAHRTAANKALLRKIQNDPEYKKYIDDLLGCDVEEYMLSGKSGAKNPLNPPKMQWHHSAYSQGKIQLIPTDVHQGTVLRELQPVLHPGENGEGGYVIFYK